MYGNTFTRSVRGISHLVRRPVDATRWVRNRVDGKSPLEMRLPWVSWPCIRELRRTVTPGMRVFEWGGGGSSIFFLEHGAEVTTMESSPKWRDAVEESVRNAGGGLHERHTLIYADAEHRDEQEIERYYNGAAEGAPWDLILVDGYEDDLVCRMPCFTRARDLVAPGGRIVLDDAWRRAYDDAPNILEGWTKREYKGLGPARPGVTRTDIYTKPAD